MDINEIQHLIFLSLQPSQQIIQEVSSQLLELIQQPESISVFVQLIQSFKGFHSKDRTYITASFIYLEKAILFQWNQFSQEDKIKVQTLILDLCFQNQAYQKQVAKLLHFFLQNFENLDAFLPYLTKEITPENITDMINFYSLIINFLPLSFLEQQKDYILFLISKSFEMIKDNIDAQISTFHVSTIYTLKFKNFSIIQDQIEPISQILYKNDISDSQYTIIITLFTRLIPNLVEYPEPQQYFYKVFLTLAEEKSLSLFRRSFALNSTRFQIKSGLLEPKEVFHLIDLSFDLIFSFEDDKDKFDCLVNILIESVNKIISEDELFQYITSIEEKALSSESPDIVSSGIYVISILMKFCPNSFYSNQVNEIKKLATFLNTSFPEKVQEAVLISIQEVNRNFTLFPIVFPKMLIPYIFYSADSTVSFNACSSLFELTRIETFNSQEFFQIMWENRNDFVKNRPEYFMEILFQCCLGLDGLDHEIQSELANLVIFYLNPEADSNLIKSAMLLSISLISFSEEPNIEILNRIYSIIAYGLQNSDDENLFATVMTFLYLFITQLKKKSFDFLKDYSVDIINAIQKVDTSQTLFAGAAIVKYWDCMQIKHIIYRRLMSRMKNELDYDDDKNFSEQEEIGQFLNSDEYFRILSFLIRYMEPQESLLVFIQALKWSKYHFDEVLKILKKLIKHAHPENYGYFISSFFNLVNESLSSNDYQSLQLVELASDFFSMETDELNQCISVLTENLKIQLNNPELSEILKDIFIGFFSDVVLYRKINEDQIKDLFVAVYSIVFQQPPQMMWQNLSYFINISFSNFPNLFELKEIHDSLQNFIQILINWIQSAPESELSMVETNDNIASLLLTIISILKLNNEEIIKISLNFFPPTDLSETASMAARILEICSQIGENLSSNSLSLFAAAVIRLLTINAEIKKKISIDDQMLQSLIALLKQLMGNADVARLVYSMFEESPEIIEFVNNLCK